MAHENIYGPGNDNYGRDKKIGLSDAEKKQFAGHEKERDLLKRLGSCRLNVKGKNTVEWDGSAIIPASLYRDLYDFLSALPEEKEEMGDRLCEYCPLEKKGVYGTNGGYVAGCEGSKCNEAYENYLEQFNPSK